MLNKHDRANFKQKWDRFWLLTRYGQLDMDWGLAIGLVIAYLLHLVCG